MIPKQLQGSSWEAVEDGELPQGVSGCPAPSRLIMGRQHLYDLFPVPFYRLGGSSVTSPVKW